MNTQNNNYNVDGRKLMSEAKFYESYSRWKDDVSRYETWEEAVQRVMSMHRQKYADKITPALENAINKTEELYKKKAVLGAQRALQFGGEQILKNPLKMYNCFSRTTRFITDKGIKSFEDFEDGDEIIVLTHKGNWEKAVVKSYGKQSLNEITFNTSTPSKYKEHKVLATGNHRWILKGGSETVDLQVGDVLTELNGTPFDYDSAEPFEKLYWCYGYVYGDGTLVKDAEGNKTHSMVRLCRQGKDVEKYSPRFEEVGFKLSTNLSLLGDVFAYTGKYLKTCPNITDDKNLFKAFVRGYLDADGTKNSEHSDNEVNRYNYLQTSDESHADFFRTYSCLGGVFVTGEQNLTGEITNFAPNGRKPTVKFHIKENINGKSAWRVTNIKHNITTETVWCLEVENDKSFVLEGGIPTGNCVSSHLDRPEFFGEYMELLLSGCGAGFSVQKQHISRLPSLKPRTKSTKIYVADDSIEGWATAFDILFSSFFSNGGKHPEYAGHPVFIDLKDIRPKGAHISGGFKAPGPEPLRKALDHVETILNKVANESRQLKSIEAYDCCMHMADAVISGGVRRSATICLFSKDDQDMITAKTGSWFIDNPQRGRSNNSAMLLRNETTFEEFHKIMESVQHSGEPGFIFTDNLEFTYNPCVEIGKLPKTVDGRSGWQGCNLTEINGSMCNTEEDFYEACYAGSVLGTLQAGYTDFPFLSPASKEIFERESLIGVSVTGWMNNPDVLFNPEVMKRGAEIVKQVNKEIAAIIGINPAARCTAVKPSGNASVLLGTASGIHGEHSKQYIRHVQMNKESEVAQLFEKYLPEMVEQSVWSANGSDIAICFPIETPDGSIYKRDLLGVKQLEYVKLCQQVWIENGTNIKLCVDPTLRHNVSNTITVDDWEAVTKFVYDNRNWFCGISFLAATGDKAYPQAPFTEVLTGEEIVAKYGPASIFASGTVTRALDAFNNNLWNACSTVMGYGENLSIESHENAMKRDWVRSCKKFAKRYFDGDLQKTTDMLKDVYNLHKWYKITNNVRNVDWSNELHKKRFTDVDTLGAVACAGGVCEITF